MHPLISEQIPENLLELIICYYFLHENCMLQNILILRLYEIVVLMGEESWAYGS